MPEALSSSAQLFVTLICKLQEWWMIIWRIVFAEGSEYKLVQVSEFADPIESFVLIYFGLVWISVFCLVKAGFENLL